MKSKLKKQQSYMKKGLHKGGEFYCIDIDKS